MPDIALWDLVSPYFLLGNAAGQWHAALAVLAVEEHETAADELGVVIRGRCRLHGDVEAFVDPRNLSFGVRAANTEGHPRDDPARREPWIDLRDTTIDFHLVAPREGSATVAAGQTALAGDAAFAPTQAVLDAWDVLPVDPLPSDYASSAFVLDLMITSAVLRPPFLTPATLRDDGLLEPSPGGGAVRLTLPRIRVRLSQDSAVDAQARMQILSLGAAGLDDPVEDLGVLQAVTMDPPYAFIGPGRLVGMGFRSAVLDLSDGATPPDVLSQFGFDEAWTGVYFPEIRLFLAPQGAEGLAVNVGVRNLLLGIGASSGVTGDFLADVINQGSGALTVGARFYRDDGVAIGIVRHDDGTAEVTLPERSRLVVDVSGGRPPYTTSIGIDGAAPTPERTVEISMAAATERTIVVAAQAPSTPAVQLTITARKRPAALTAAPTPASGAVPRARVTASATTRGGTPVGAPELVIDRQDDDTVTLRLSDRSPADWQIDGVPAGTAGARTVTAPLPAGGSITVIATAPGVTTRCPVYFRYDQPAQMTDAALEQWAQNPENTRTSEAADAALSSGWTGGGPVAEDDAYALALQTLPQNASIVVVGHASFENDDSKHGYNKLLSERRAKVARSIYQAIAAGRFKLDAVTDRSFDDAKPAQQNLGEPRRRWWRAELPSDVTVPGLVTTGTVVRDAVPPVPPPVPIPERDPIPKQPEKPSFFRSIGVKVRIVRDEFVAVELHGEVDFDTASEQALRDKAPAGDMPTFQGLGSQNPGDGIVTFRGVFTRNPGDDEWALILSFGADPSDVDGLLMTGAPAGTTVARSTGRDVLGLYTLFLPLLAGVAPETPGDAEVGDLVLAGALAALPIGLAGTGWFTVERVIWYGGEVRVLQRHGAWSTAILADVEVAVSADVEFGGQSLIVIEPATPLTARYKAVGLRFGQSPSGELLFHPVFDSAKGYTLDIARNGSLRVAEPLGSILRVVGARISRTNPVFFEIELGGAVDLGVISLDRCGVRVQLDASPPTVELTALGASVDIPGTLTGSGYFNIANDGFAGRIDLTIVPLKLRVAAAIAVRDIPAAAGGPATAVAIAMEVQFPVAIPLANSGLGIYGFLGLFAMHFTRNEAPDAASATKALSWLKRANGDPTQVQDPALWTPAIDRWAFGVGMLVGTMGSEVVFNMKGLVVLELPGPRLLLMMKANVLQPMPDLKGAGEGNLLAVVDLDAAAHTLTIGIVIEYKIEPILRIRIPVEAFFDTDEPQLWHLYLGKWADPVRAQVLSVFTGTGYLMLVGNGGTNPDLNPELPKPAGFAIAAGLHVSMVWGAKPARLYAELAAGFDAILGFSPLIVAGKIYARGELRLFIVSIGAHAELNVRLGELNGVDGYKVWGEVCGSVDLFFFEIKGCVDFSLESGTPPGLTIPPLLSGVSLVSRSPALAHGTATDQAVDAALADAIAGPTEPNWNALPAEVRAKVGAVPIDAIPVVQFTAPPFDRAHPGNTTRGTLQFEGSDVDLNGTSGGRQVQRSDDKVTYEVTAVDLTPDASGGPTPATWWTPRPPNKANEGVQLALLTWDPTPTPKALQRSVSLDEYVTDRWGTVCSAAAPPTSVLWTFRFEPLGPEPAGWTVTGEPWPDPPNTVRSTPAQVEMRVTERWRCGDPAADALRGIGSAEVVGAVVGCPRDGGVFRTPFRDAQRVAQDFGVAQDIGRRRLEPLSGATLSPVDVLQRLDRGEEISRAAMSGVVATVDRDHGQQGCDSRILAAPRFDTLVPVPEWNAAKADEVKARWQARDFDPGDLANAVVLEPGEFERVLVLLFVARRALGAELVVVRAEGPAGPVDERAAGPGDEVGWVSLPGPWTDPGGPWDDDVWLVMQHYLALNRRDGYVPVLVGVRGGEDVGRVIVGVRDTGALADQNDAVSGPFFFVAAAEALAFAEIRRHDYDTSTQEADHAMLEASLGAASGSVALLAPGTAYKVDVTWSATASATTGETASRPSGSESFWFRTADQPPDRLDPWVLAGTPYDGEPHVFGAEPLQLSFNTATVLDVFAAYGQRLEVRLSASSGRHPDPAETGQPHPFAIAAGFEPIPASVLSPWEGAIIDAIAVPGFGAPANPEAGPCIEVDGQRTRHSKTTIPIPLHAATDYLLDVERVPLTAAAGTRGQRVYRRAFTTSRFATLAEFARFVRGTPVVHRYAPVGAMAAIAAALPTGEPAGEDFDLAFENAGLGRFPVPDLPQVLVFWEGATGLVATTQPTAVLIDANEPLWRLRERARLVPLPGTDVSHYELTRDVWIEPQRAATSTTPVTRVIRAPGGQRGLLLLGAGARGTRLQVELARRRFVEPYLDGPGPDETEPLFDVAFLRAPWEE